MRGVKFGPFEFDAEKLRLVRGGIPVKIPPQPATVLRLLLLEPGAIVTRERIREELWPSGTFVEFDLSLNASVNRLRRALLDSADNPRYIETIPKVGYRFVGSVEAPAPASAVAPAPPASQPERSSFLSLRMALAIAALVAVSLVGGWWWSRLPVPNPLSAPYLSAPQMTAPAGSQILSLAASPDSSHFAYVVRLPQKTSPNVVYRRYFNEDHARKVEGSEDALYTFFSPDGKQLAVVTPTAIKVLSPDGSSREVTRLDGLNLVTAVWAPDGWIYFSLTLATRGGIWRIPNEGGNEELLLPSEAKPNGIEYVMVREVLGDRVLYSARTGPRHNDLYAYSIAERRSWKVASDTTGGMTGGGMVVYEKQRGLFAAPWDPVKFALGGPEARLVEGVAQVGWRGPLAAITPKGQLVYVLEAPLEARDIVKFNAGSDQARALPFPAGEFEQLRISPADSKVIAAVVRDGAENWSLREMNTVTGLTETLLSTTVQRPRVAWSPDGRDLAVSSEIENGDFVNVWLLGERSAGSGKRKMTRLTEQPNFGQLVISWSGQNQQVVFAEGVRPGTKSDLKSYSFADRKVRTLVQTPGWDVDGIYSPDGKQFAYASDGDGPMSVYVAGATGVKRLVSGARHPVWSADGQKLWYVAGEELFQTALKGGEKDRQRVAAGAFATFDGWTRPFDVAADGSVVAIRRQPERREPLWIHAIGTVAEAYRRSVR